VVVAALASGSSGEATAAAGKGTTTVRKKALTTVQKKATTTSAPPVGGPPAPAACAGCWKPPVVLSFQVQYSGTIDLTVEAQLFDLDGFDTPKATVDQLHANGKNVACYLSAWSFEDWRRDAAAYPAAVLGSPLDGWPGERWVDVRDVRKPDSALATILRSRLELCRQKGFDAVDPDNVDGYTNKSGFPLTAADQLFFNAWLANEAHGRGLAVALKNDLDQAATLVGWFDFAVNEQCHEYAECNVLVPFVNAGKPVLQIEYAGDPAAFCPPANARNFNAVKKRLSLNAYRVACR
jgi:hypothetical protein